MIFLFTAHESQARTGSRGGNPRYAAVIMDAQSGRVLHQENPHKSLPPASLTKMMTLFMTFEAIENGKIHMNKYLTISQNAINQQPSKLGLRRNSKITVKEAIYVLVTRSANDVAMALAETIGGSNERFCQQMTQRARSLGMKESTFYNPHGLPNPGQKSSAMDMAVLGRALMQYFPQHYHFFNTIRYNYHGQTIETHNNLMRRFKGMDGLKTGYTYASGFNLVASAVRNNRRVIVSVFGGRTAYTRDNHVAELMERGFAMMSRGQMGVQVAAAQPAPKPVTKTVTTTVATTTVKTPAPAAAKPAAVAVTQTKKVTQTTTVAANTNTQWKPDGGQVRTLGTQAVRVTQPAPVPYKAPAPAPVVASSSQPKNWGIQIGAYSDAAQGQQMLRNVQNRLRGVVPEVGQAVVVPIVTAQGTLYRARIIGLTSNSASRACQAIGECMAFAMR